MKCTRCGSFAINAHLHGRDGGRLDLCDVCWWRNRAELLEFHITNLEHAGMHAMLPDANVIDRNRWDEAVRKRP